MERSQKKPPLLVCSCRVAIWINHLDGVVEGEDVKLTVGALSSNMPHFSTAITVVDLTSKYILNAVSHYRKKRGPGREDHEWLVYSDSLLSYMLC